MPEEQEEQQQPTTIYVKSTLKPRADSGYPTALWERDAAHPNGEVFIAGDKPVQVGVTAEVSRLLRDGVLVKADAPAAPKPQSQTTGDKK